MKTDRDEFGPALADSLDRFVGTIEEEGEASLPAPLAEFAAGLAPSSPGGPSGSAASSRRCATSARPCGPGRPTPS